MVGRAGRLLWSTFSGGARVQGKIGNQGARSGTNAYDPATNEIEQVEITGAPPRWLAGWINVDTLLAADGEAKK